METIKRNIINSFNNTGMLRNPRFMEFCIRKGIISSYLKNCEEDSCKEDFLHKYLSVIETFRTVLNSFFKDKWDFRISDNFKLQVIIHFPEVILNNSVGESTKINNFFFKFSLLLKDGGQVYISDYSGLTTKYTFAQYNSYYAHSHVNWDHSDGLSLFKNFCMGGNDALKAATDLEFSQDYSEINVISFLLLLKSAVEWESLEGTPYKYIKNISSLDTCNSYILSSFSRNSVLNIISKIPHNLFNFIIDDGRVKFDFTSELEEWIKKNLYDDFGDDLLAIKNSDGDLVRYDIENNTYKRYLNYKKGAENQSFKFRNVDFPLVIVKPSEDETCKISLENLHLNPKVKKSIIDELNKELYGKQLRDCYFRN